MPTDLIAILAVFLALAVWLDTMRQHERALAAARQLCTHHGVQLLDSTVGLSGLKLRRIDGELVFERRYAFEVSTDGSDRRPGCLWMSRGHMSGCSADWLRAPPTPVLDAEAEVIDLLERIRRKQQQDPAPHPHDGDDPRQ